MFTRFVIAIVLAVALVLVAGGTRAEFNADGILSPAEQEVVMRDIRSAMQQLPEIYKADIYPEGVIVVYYDDDGGKADGTCDNAILFQIGAMVTSPDGVLVPMIIPMISIPTCADAESLSRMYFEDKGAAPNSVARPDSPKIENMQFNRTGELTPDEYQKLVIYFVHMQMKYKIVVKVYIHEVYGMAMVFIDTNNDGQPERVDHLQLVDLQDADPLYFKVSEGSVQEAEYIYQNYLEWLNKYKNNHSV